MKYLILLGTGGFARELLWLAREINQAMQARGRQEPYYRILGFIGKEEEAATEWSGMPLLGDDAWAIENLERNVLFAPAVGNPHLRQQLSEKYLQAGFRPATLVHPSVHMSEEVRLGQGCVLAAGAVLTTNIELGDFVTVNLNATVGHDSILEDFVTVHPGANVSGNVKLETRVEVGTGVSIIPGCTVGADAVLGAGTVVTTDLAGGRTYVGTPAKALPV